MLKDEPCDACGVPLGRKIYVIRDGVLCSRCRNETHAYFLAGLEEEEGRTLVGVDPSRPGTCHASISQWTRTETGELRFVSARLISAGGVAPEPAVRCP